MPILINGELVDDDVVREEAARIRGPMAEAMPDLDEAGLRLQAWEWARENIIERVLLRQAAGADGMEALTARITAPVPPPSPKDVSDYYRAHRQSFQAPEQVHAAHVVKHVEEHTDAETALAAIGIAEAELKTGRRFELVADAHSDCPGNGGDLGWIVRGQMVGEFEAVVFALPVGRHSEIFRSPFGFHIAKVLGKRPAGILSLNDVRGEIVQALHAQRKQQAIEAFTDELRARAEIRKAPSSA